MDTGEDIREGWHGRRSICSLDGCPPASRDRLGQVGPALTLGDRPNELDQNAPGAQIAGASKALLRGFVPEDGWYAHPVARAAFLHPDCSKIQASWE